MSLAYKSQKKRRKDLAKYRITSWEDYEAAVKELEKERLHRLRLQQETPKTVRVIGGKIKGTVLDVPARTRPFTSRMRTTLFDVLRDVIEDKKVLDLYSGSGSLGLEALSRGAKSVDFVDAAKQAESMLNENIKKTPFLVETEVIRSRAEDYLPPAINSGEQFEIIFSSPPFKLFNKRDRKKMEKLINQTAKLLPGVADPETDLYKGLLILQYPTDYPIDKLNLPDLELYDELVFGRNTIGLFIVKHAAKKASEKAD